MPFEITDNIYNCGVLLSILQPNYMLPLKHRLPYLADICICRNFPQGTIGDMVKDASQGISFICNNISEYGGDPNKYSSNLHLLSNYFTRETICKSRHIFLPLWGRIYLMGQSAGAHIAACALVQQAIKEAGEAETTSWSVSQIKAYFGLSGG